MATNNPIEIGIRMADRTLAAFGIKPEPAALDMCQYCGSVYAAHGMITATCPDGLTSFAPPKPTYSLNAQLELSLLQADIHEANAQLQTQETLEQAHRDILVAQYAMLAYYATRCRDRLATRQWVQVPSEEQTALAHAEVEVTTASSNHDDMIDAIAELRITIRQKQAKFDAIVGSKAGRA